MVQIVNPGSPGAKNLPFALCNTTTGPRRGHWLGDPSSRDAWALGVKRHLSNLGGPPPGKGSDRVEAFGPINSGRAGCLAVGLSQYLVREASDSVLQFEWNPGGLVFST